MPLGSSSEAPGDESRPKGAEQTRTRATTGRRCGGSGIRYGSGPPDWRVDREASGIAESKTRIMQSWRCHNWAVKSRGPGSGRRPELEVQGMTGMNLEFPITSWGIPSSIPWMHLFCRAHSSPSSPPCSPAATAAPVVGIPSPDFELLAPANAPSASAPRRRFPGRRRSGHDLHAADLDGQRASRRSSVDQPGIAGTSVSPATTLSDGPCILARPRSAFVGDVPRPAPRSASRRSPRCPERSS